MNMKINLIISFLLLNFIFSQTLGQIKSAKEMVKNRGMSQKEALDAARSMGYSDKDIKKILDKDKISNSNNIISDEQKIEEQIHLKVGKSNNTLIEQSESASIDKSSLKNVKSKNRTLGPTDQNYFGYNIFKQDPALFQGTSVGSVAPDYLIGPGDEIIVMLWGETQFRQLFMVDREGFIFVPEIGQVFVNGLNLNLLESKLFRVFSQSYASLNPQGGKSTTFLDISLGNLRPLRVQVLGQVDQPGAYTVSPSTTLFSSLYYFNGPSTSGSLRDIQLIRDGEVISSIDFYDFLLTGKKPEDQKLQLDDVIFIPRRLKTISIEGEINRSGIYELKPGENLSDLISMAGELKITAYLDRAQIDRVVAFEDREDLGMDRMIIDINLNKNIQAHNKLELKTGDRIKIFSIFDSRPNTVDIFGAINRPGRYDLRDSLKLSELIENADGLIGDAYLERIDIVRTNEDLSNELININLEKILNKISQDFLLKSLDKIRIYSLSEMVNKKYVSISGHVKRPDTIELKDNMTAYDLIFTNGGFLDEEFKNSAHLKRADLLRFNKDQITKTILKFNLDSLLRYPNSNSNFPLVSGDEIRIYKKNVFISEEPVFINGNVESEGPYNFKTNMNLKDLIIESGGFINKNIEHMVEIVRLRTQPKNHEIYSEISILKIDSNLNLELIKTDGKIINKKIKQFLLRPYDRVSLRRNPFAHRERTVLITGEVVFPGLYSIVSANERISDIINRSGGLTLNAYPEASSYIRNGNLINISIADILNNNKKSSNFVVQHGDQINIQLRPNIVQVQGAVNNPGKTKFIEKKHLKYYLKISGGLNPNSDKKNIWVDYPNGDSKTLKAYSFRGPKIIDGSVINVGEIIEKEEFDKTEFAKEMTSIIANFAQVVIMILIAKG